MDVKLRQGSLEYNVIGGILDLYFIGGNGGKASPADVSRGYAKLVRSGLVRLPGETNAFTHRLASLPLFRTGVSVFINVDTAIKVLSIWPMSSRTIP
jgi:hypothetical protein